MALPSQPFLYTSLFVLNLESNCGIGETMSGATVVECVITFAHVRDVCTVVMFYEFKIFSKKESF